MNNLNINVNKCQQISFSRRMNPIQISYKINNVSLNVVSDVKDLGVWLSSDLLFKLHMEKIYKKALKVLGFIRRNTWEFNNPTCIKVLYCSLVRFIIEYCSVVLNPFSGIWVSKLETIKNRLLKFLAPKLGLPINNFYSVAKQCGLDPLFKRRLFK